MTRNLLDVMFAVGKAGLSGTRSMLRGSAVLLPALMLVATTAAGQQAQSTLQLVTYVHVVPGKNVEFEAVHQERNARMAAADVSFRNRISVLEGQPSIYRSVTPGLANMAALDARRAELDAMGAGDPDRILGVIDHIESEVRRTRPDLSYAAENPRMPFSEVRFFRSIEVYLRAGTQARYEEQLKALVALHERHGTQTSFFVSSAVQGSGPSLRISIPARDAADFFAEYQAMEERLGEERQALLVEMNPLTRRLEWANRVVRRDLGYQPN